jgi:hypothetical protein
MKEISLTSLFPHGQNVPVRQPTVITVTVEVPAGRTHAWLATFQILKTKLNQINQTLIQKKGNGT